MNEPAIREATSDDIVELSRLRWQLYTEGDAAIDEPFESYRERFDAFARWAFERDDWRAWVVEEGGQLLGTAWLQTVPRVPAPGRRDPSPIGYLTNVYVEESRRGTGLGSALLETVRSHCRAHGFELMLTFPAIAAYAFYDRAGFTRARDPVVLHLESAEA
jgi:GNAT superfamily N-acetyltransferase